MQPWITVDRVRTADGVELALARRGEEWILRVGTEILMTSRAHHSEEALATLALARLSRPSRVLIGGLGMGYTLRAALDLLPSDGRVLVAELSAALIGWNQGPLAPLAGRPLEDPRVSIHQGDVFDSIASAREDFDAILLDVDNGPRALCLPRNDRLYGPAGLAACRQALRPGGILAIWSAGPPEERARAQLRRAGFKAEMQVVPGHEGGGTRHGVYLASRP